MLVEFMSRNLCHLQELLVRYDMIIVKQEENEHLIRGAQEFVPLALLESSTDLSIAQCQLPVQ